MFRGFLKGHDGVLRWDVGHGHILHMQLLRLQLGIRCQVMQVVERTLLFGTFAKELWFIQPMDVLVENVLVVSKAGQCTVHCVVQSEELLRILIKGFVWSLGSLFQCIDCVNHGRKGRELHLQTFLQFDPWCRVTFRFEMREHGSTRFQGGNAVLSPMLIIGRTGSLTGSIFNFADPLKEVLTLLSVEMRDCVKPEPQTCLSILTHNGGNFRSFWGPVFLQ